jgi:hypothetical protein
LVKKNLIVNIEYIRTYKDGNDNFINDWGVDWVVDVIEKIITLTKKQQYPKKKDDLMC